jgi:hypothetical protein
MFAPGQWIRGRAPDSASQNSAFVLQLWKVLLASSRNFNETYGHHPSALTFINTKDFRSWPRSRVGW